MWMQFHTLLIDVLQIPNPWPWFYIRKIIEMRRIRRTVWSERGDQSIEWKSMFNQHFVSGSVSAFVTIRHGKRNCQSRGLFNSCPTVTWSRRGGRGGGRTSLPADRVRGLCDLFNLIWNRCVNGLLCSSAVLLCCSVPLLCSAALVLFCLLW